MLGLFIMALFLMFSPVLVFGLAIWGLLVFEEKRIPIARWRWIGIIAAGFAGGIAELIHPLTLHSVEKLLENWEIALIQHHHLIFLWELLPWGPALGLTAWTVGPVILRLFRPPFEDHTFDSDRTVSPVPIPLRSLRRFQRYADKRMNSFRFPLGINRQTFQPLWLDDGQLNQGVSVYGATGSGKTTTLNRFILHALRTQKPLIVLDGKGDMAWANTIGQWTMTHGRMFHHWSVQGPATWNPLKHGAPTELKDKLIGLTDWSEPHYRYAAERFLQALFSAMLSAQIPVTLTTVADYFLGGSNALISLARHAGSSGAPLLSALDAMASDRSLASAVYGLAQRVAVLAESDAGPYLEDGPAGIDLREVLQDPAGSVVVFTLPALQYSEFVPLLGALVLLDIRTAIAHFYRQQRRTAALLVVDEFGAFASDQALTILAQSRGSGLGTIIATQDPEDYARVDPHLPYQVFANTAVKIVHRLDNPNSAELAARAFGTQKAHELTHQIRNDRQALGLMGTVRAVDEFIVHPQIIKTLPVGLAAVSIKVPRSHAEIVQVFPV